MSNQFMVGDVVWGYRLHIDTAKSLCSASDAPDYIGYRPLLEKVNLLGEFKGRLDTLFTVFGKKRPHCIVEDCGYGNYNTVQLFSDKDNNVGYCRFPKPKKDGKPRYFKLEFVPTNQALLEENKTKEVLPRQALQEIMNQVHKHSMKKYSEYWVSKSN